jgi:hypothetical protein
MDSLQLKATMDSPTIARAQPANVGTLIRFPLDVVDTAKTPAG